MQRFYICKSDIDRLQHISGRFGKQFPVNLLDYRDRLCRAHPSIEPFLSDIVLAAAVDRFHLAVSDLDTLPEEVLLKVVAWAHVVLSTEISSAAVEVLEPALLELARSKAQLSKLPGLPYTVLMRALYHLDPTVTEAYALHGDDRPTDLLCWYYLDAVRRYRLHRCVSSLEIDALNASRQVYGFTLLSLLDIWALHRGDASFANYSLETATGQIQAREAAWTIREADPVFDFYRPRIGRSRIQPDASSPPARARPGRVAGADIMPILYKHRTVQRGHAEYLGVGCSGNRLLLAGEWGVEQGFAWSLAPIATIAFALDEQHQKAVSSIGLTIKPYAAADTLGQNVTVFLNGVDILTFPVADALTRDAVATDSLPFVPGLNLLQLAVDVPLVPSVNLGSQDTRALGPAFRRVWVA